MQPSATSRYRSLRPPSLRTWCTGLDASIHCAAIPACTRARAISQTPTADGRASCRRPCAISAAASGSAERSRRSSASRTTHALKELAGTPGAGRVLLVDGGGSTRHALLGDTIAKEALEHGWAGIVVHGSVRDTGRARDPRSRHHGARGDAAAVAEERRRQHRHHGRDRRRGVLPGRAPVRGRGRRCSSSTPAPSRPGIARDGSTGGCSPTDLGSRHGS